MKQESDYHDYNSWNGWHTILLLVLALVFLLIVLGFKTSHAAPKPDSTAHDSTVTLQSMPKPHTIKIVLRAFQNQVATFGIIEDGKETRTICGVGGTVVEETQIIYPGELVIKPDSGRKGK